MEDTARRTSPAARAVQTLLRLPAAALTELFRTHPLALSLRPRIVEGVANRHSVSGNDLAIAATFVLQTFSGPTADGVGDVLGVLAKRGQIADTDKPELQRKLQQIFDTAGTRILELQSLGTRAVRLMNIGEVYQESAHQCFSIEFHEKSGNVKFKAYRISVTTIGNDGDSQDNSFVILEEQLKDLITSLPDVEANPSRESIDE